MKVNLRFLLLTVFVLVLVTDPAFTQLVFGPIEDPIMGKYHYMLVGISAVLGVVNIRYMSSIMRAWFLVVLLSLGALALESYNGWGRWMVYPHVFGKLTVMLSLFAVYGYHCRKGLPPFRPLARFILVGLLLNLALVNQNALSVSAFLDNERGFAVTSAYLFLVVALFCLNWFLTRGGTLNVVVFFLCMGMIVFLQHRTVWVSAAVSLPLNILLLRRVPGVRFTMNRILLLTLLPFLVGSVGGIATVLENPAVLKKLESSIDDIQNPDKQGTGNWRMKQYESYKPFIAERPVLGWRIEGFELPVQFYSTDTDAPIWENFTGHHFHSFYLDRLFYFGVFGVLLVVLVPIIVVVQRLLQPGPLPPETAALIACGANLLVYSISYDWSPYQFALVGLVLAAVQASAPVPISARAVTAPLPAPPAAEPVLSY
ncbi:O-antigen ligase family protein [Hymenobacter koreensis]|uniref:O-antigen ligase-related domain-containing protein n=1 Tax=Hymenobacter koreensis TaxID=1084523 RepID=A0ABP8IYT7_9BACT